MCGSIKPQFHVTWCPTFPRARVIPCVQDDSLCWFGDPRSQWQLRATWWTCPALHTSARARALPLRVFSSPSARPLFHADPRSHSSQLPAVAPNLPFGDVTSCHGNCLLAHSPLMEGAAAAAVDQLDGVARQQVTWRSLATTLLQEPANPLNLSLSPSPNTSLPPPAPVFPKLPLALLTPKPQRQL